jgi:hypothetical protein
MGLLTVDTRETFLAGERSHHISSSPRRSRLIGIPIILRVRAIISWHFGASAGPADARRRDAGDVVTSSRSGNAAAARPPPRPGGLPVPRSAISYASFLQDSQIWELAAKCQVIFARALSRVRKDTSRCLIGNASLIHGFKHSHLNKTRIFN